VKWLILTVGLILAVLFVPGWLLWRRHVTNRDFEALRHALVLEEREQRADRWPRPALPGEPVDGAARDYYARAVAALDGSVEGDERAIALISAGTRTAEVGDRVFPVRTGWTLPRLDEAMAASIRVAATEGDTDRVLTRALEMVQFGTDLARGSTGMERYYGVRLARRGALMIAPGSLDGERRAWVENWTRGPRTASAVVSGLRLSWLNSYRNLIEGSGPSAWKRKGDGPATDVGVPDELNPEYLSDREIVAAWRGLAATFRRLEAEIDRGSGAGERVRQVLKEAGASAGPFEAQAYLHIGTGLLVELAMEAETRTLLLDLLPKGE